MRALESSLTSSGYSAGLNPQYDPPGGHAFAGPLNVPLPENSPPAPIEGVCSALKNQLKKASLRSYCRSPYFLTGSTFIGNILAQISITVTTGVTMAGRLLARTGAVTLDTTALTYPPATVPGGFGGPPLPTPTPAPSSWILVLIGLGCAMLYQTRKRHAAGTSKS
jgi:hypothetical protein